MKRQWKVHINDVYHGNVTCIVLCLNVILELVRLCTRRGGSACSGRVDMCFVDVCVVQKRWRDLYPVYTYVLQEVDSSLNEAAMFLVN